jgi:hypothetical protein
LEISPATPSDGEWHAALAGTLDEWSSAEDQKDWADL